MQSPENTKLINILARENIEVIGHIFSEPLYELLYAPVYEKEKYIHNFLNNYFSTTDFTRSFDRKLAIILDEAVTYEIILALHSWINQQSCRVANIKVISTHTLGSAEWYKQYCQLMGHRAVGLIDAPWQGWYIYDAMKSIESSLSQSKHKDLKYYFDFYGGTRSLLDRDFLTALFLTRKNLGHVEYLAGFSSSLSEFDNYLEELTGFGDRVFCDQLQSARQQSEFTTNEIPRTQTLQMSADVNYNKTINQQSAVNIIRETFNDQPFASVTEKTLKPFCQMQIPVPLGPNTVAYLEQLGLLFDHDLLDYSYQSEPIFLHRMNRVVAEIDKLSAQYDLKKLAERIYTSRHILEHNYNYILSGKLFDRVHEKLIRELHE